MLNSRDIDALRPDVAAACRTLIERAAKQGCNVLVTGTVRDEEYQREAFRRGTALSPLPAFHAVHAGLAFDVCKNVRGHEYDDPDFFAAVGAIGKSLGLTWGGDWKSFPDRPHFQWDQGGRYTADMVRQGCYPPELTVEDDMLTQEQFDAMMETWLQSRAEKDGAAWSAEARTWAEEQGLIVGDGEGRRQYASFVTREQLMVFLKRLWELKF